ncbi:NAD(P)-dependent oxidoreductase [Rhizobium leguminosarum]|uniref:NAD(P)-dependent oxidoreductase n=1 Tax=Rhizobium leguminosarum TaxID=384 RepID=UPI001030E119|nr:NAD(P)-dependent oxidoreductase [Rhizobium leguminosarum]MBY5898784.1 NAD(P)-dependent oxidoreductase [Rhizobium leguminosarum]MBY5907924.1 NAD(P)-dependent oxidoreductase [Rhizobium leguminosarum]QIO74405.1 NAD(P)-dependent oxidoreductase [Rhizobium leguminosarum bv. trifolii]QIO81423.1 NAD(P)-dependent oxidoreductase [Rhizobium leguminosarum bv. trifolii]TAV12490.1 NAD(P)-dependent oxidoreductase [Rhizobium leguminosarum]
MTGSRKGDEGRRIAFLGTGLMGAPMARRLLGAGFAVTVWNRDPGKAEALAGDGAVRAETPADAVAGADVVITMLTNAEAVKDVLFDRGAADAMKPGVTVIDMSSIAPHFARDHSARLADRGVDHVDAPVSGGVVGAEAGTLAIMAGGAEDVIDRLADVFAPMGRVTRVGPSGAGQLAKLANQQIVAVTIGAVAEAMMLIEVGGGSPAAFRDAIRGGFAESRILELHGKRMVERQFTPGGSSSNQLKDLNAAMEAAKTLSLRLPLTAAVHAEFSEFVANGNGEKDHSALLLHLEEKNARPGGKK